MLIPIINFCMGYIYILLLSLLNVGYGMTEVSLAATAFGWVKPPKRGSIGFLLPNMQGKVRQTLNCYYSDVKEE